MYSQQIHNRTRCAAELTYCHGPATAQPIPVPGRKQQPEVLCRSLHASNVPDSGAVLAAHEAKSSELLHGERLQDAGCMDPEARGLKKPQDQRGLELKFLIIQILNVRSDAAGRLRSDEA